MHTVFETSRRRARKSRSLRIDEFGNLEHVCFKGGSSETKYVQSPEERRIMRMLMPALKGIYSGTGDYPTNLNLYPIPDLNIDLPEMRTPDAMRLNLPDIADYTAGGSEFSAVYDKIAPSMWNAYESGVQDPMIERFAGSGSLGSPYAGLSGSAAGALEEGRRKAGADISSQVFQAAQSPLLAAFQQAGQGELQRATTEYGADQTRALTEYGAEASAAGQESMAPWEAQQQMYQYPYQILPGLAGGTMPQAVTQSGGGKK